MDALSELKRMYQAIRRWDSDVQRLKPNEKKIFEAVYNAQPDILRELLQSLPDVDITSISDSDGSGLLELACLRVG